MIVLGSASDFDVAEKSIGILENLGYLIRCEDSLSTQNA